MFLYRDDYYHKDTEKKHCRGHYCQTEKTTDWNHLNWYGCLILMSAFLLFHDRLCQTVFVELKRKYDYNYR